MNAAALKPIPTNGSSFATSGATVWSARRNCSVSPRQLLALYGVLCALSLAVALFCWWMGARLVLAFTGLELLAVGAALLVWARHANDGEAVFVHEGRLVIDQERGGRRERVEFQSPWVRVGTGPQGWIEIAGHGRRVQIGRYVRADLRRAAAIQIEHALRARGIGVIPASAG